MTLDRKEELMEHVEEERLTTADLADAGREEPRTSTEPLWRL
jgi:hypothetical protein